MKVYVVFQVASFQSAVDIKEVVALRSSRSGAEAVVSHLTATDGQFGFDHEIEEWAVLP